MKAWNKLLKDADDGDGELNYKVLRTLYNIVCLAYCVHFNAQPLQLDNGVKLIRQLSLNNYGNNDVTDHF